MCRNKIGYGPCVEHFSLLNDVIGFLLLRDADGFLLLNNADGFLLLRDADILYDADGLLSWVIFFLAKEVGVLCGDGLERLHPVGDQFALPLSDELFT
jgi:hypothetical protein